MEDSFENVLKGKYIDILRRNMEKGAAEYGSVNSPVGIVGVLIEKPFARTFVEFIDKYAKNIFDNDKKLLVYNGFEKCMDSSDYE